MQWKVSMIVLIGMSALFVTGCGTVRNNAVRESTEVRINGFTEERCHEFTELELRDTVVEVTTITIDRNEVGDTVKVVQVTDRTRAKAKSDVKSKMVDVRVMHDTVYVAMRDSSYVETTDFTDVTDKPFGLVGMLRWAFWIIVALAGLLIIFKIKN